MLFRALLLVLIFEGLFCGYALIQRAARPAPVLPDTRLMDPLFVEDIQPLVKQASEENNPFAWMQLGEALLGQGFYSHAERCFEQVAQLVPGSRLADSRIAYCRERTGRTEESTEIYRRLNETAEATPEAQREQMQTLYEIGRNYLREENIKEAEAVFRQNLGFLPARYQLAKLLIRSDRIDEALPLIQDSLARVPRSLKFRELELQAYRRAGDTRAATAAALQLERANHSVPLHPGSTFIEPYRLQYGIDRRTEEFNQRISKDSLDQLADELEQLIAQLGDRATTHRAVFLMRLLEVDLQRQQPDRMLKTIAELNGLGIQSAEILLYRAEARALQGDLDQAANFARRAAPMSKVPELHQRVSELLNQAGEESESKIEQALSLRLLALQFYRNDELEPALKAIGESLELNPEDAHAWYAQAIIQQALGQNKEALTSFEECLKRDPHHGRALERQALVTASQGS